MKTMMKKKFHLHDQRKLKILSDKICDEIESLLSFFGIEYKIYAKMITMSCPIHGGDNASALNLYPEGERYRGNWKCRTHHCEEIFKSSIIGFIRGVLSRQQHGWCKDGDEMASFEEALTFGQDFVKQNLSDIKIDRKTIEKSNFVNTIQYINTKTAKHSINYVDQLKVQKSLSTRTHKCPYCKYEADRDVNAAINILKKGLSTVGHTGSYQAWGETASTLVGEILLEQAVSMNQESQYL